MSFFAVYFPDTTNSGEIRRFGRCQAEMVALQARAGEMSIATDFLATSALYKIVNGAVEEKTK